MPRQRLAAVPVPLPPRQRSRASLPERRGTLGLLFTGKVIRERGKEVPDDGDAPRPPQQLLASPAADVGDVRAVEREAEDPAEQRGRVRPDPAPRRPPGRSTPLPHPRIHPCPLRVPAPVSVSANSRRSPPALPLPFPGRQHPNTHRFPPEALEAVAKGDAVVPALPRAGGRPTPGQQRGARSSADAGRPPSHPPRLCASSTRVRTGTERPDPAADLGSDPAGGARPGRTEP